MKRSKSIQFSHMRQKLTPSFLLTPVAIAITTFLLSSCSDDEEVMLVESVEQCTTSTELSQGQCEAAYQQAQEEADRTGPKYQSQSTCEAEFGYQQCHQSNSGFFTPFMTGFMVSQIMRPSGYYPPVYRYNSPSSNNYNKIMTADGYVLGKAGSSRYQVSSNQFKPKATVSKTISRGGFGSTASAKSSWGGGSKSSGWGS